MRKPLTKEEIDKKVDKVLEILDTLIKRQVVKALTGIDGSMLRKYIKEIKSPTGSYRTKTILEKIKIFKTALEDLGFRYKEIAKDLEDIINFLEEKEKTEK